MKKLLIFTWALILGVSQAFGAVEFTINSFTANELNLTLTGDTALSGSTPTFNRHALFLVSSGGQSGSENDWFLTDTAAVKNSTGTLGGKNVEIESFFSDFEILSFNFGSNLSSGETVSSGGLNISITGTNLFNPSKVTTFDLYWGGSPDNAAGIGTFQDSFQSAAAVPEPSTYAILLGALTLAFATFSRRIR